jgi:serine/threonine protein kinase
MTSPSQPRSAVLLHPDQVIGGKYRVKRLLAEGGMAAVWEGTNDRTGKQVALKIMLPVFAALGDAMELFRREALAASKVNHPNVVNIFDVIDHEGMTCIVMELLDGESLATYLAARGPLPLQEAVELLLPAMRGVAAANARGIVHRDLKPGNLFLCRDPQGRLLTTKVLDFGISMSAERSVDYGAVGGGSGPDELLVRLGTPAYMAPEDVEYPQIVDSRTDVYGFGVLLFEMLTGSLPFPGEPSQALFARILRQPPPRVASFRADLPSQVQTILDNTLAKNPSNRFPDVEHLIRAVEDHLYTSSGQLSFPRTLVLGRSAVDESQMVSLVTVTSSAGDSGPTRISSKKGWRHGLAALCERRTVAAALLVGALLLSPWLALHGSRGRPPVSVQPPRPSPAPLITAMPIAPTASPLTSNADATRGHLRAALAVDEPTRTPPRRSPPRAQLHLKANPFVTRQTPPAAPPKAARAHAMDHRTQPPGRSSQPRAGTLFPSDF